MLEIEVKAEATDELLRNVRERGERIFEKKQVDMYYAHPCWDFGETDEALRVREEDGSLLLAYKGPKIDAESKSRLEVETPAGVEVAEVLERLGFEPLPAVVKRRAVFEVEGFTVTVDRVEGLPVYVEAETGGPEEELEYLRDRLRELLVDMGAERFERRSYLELLFEG
ncbi:MAG: hypothetical protein MAG715_00610 [Methanonatronarchaeales archaeon]|nr:hypothetical protein [Methanonatronarchaeales archaeon]